MNIERELLKECRLMLDNPFNGSAGLNLRNKITELLAQPKPEPLSDAEIEQTTQGMSEFGADMFKAGIKAAEKAHGIGE